MNLLPKRAPHKPREILVQSFYYREREVNEYIDWLPGNEPPLTRDQLKQAFFDSMPSLWSDRFDEADHSNSHVTLAQVLRYFRKQCPNNGRKQSMDMDTSSNNVCSTRHIHYKMKRHRPGAGLCYFGLRCVSATQTGRAVCVSTILCQIDTLRRRIVFSSVAHLISITNDRLP